MRAAGLQRPEQNAGFQPESERDRDRERQRERETEMKQVRLSGREAAAGTKRWVYREGLTWLVVFTDRWSQVQSVIDRDISRKHTYANESSRELR